MLIGLLSLFLSWNIQASNLKSTCEISPSKIYWAYCITESEGSQSTDVAYFLHGMGGSHYSWQEPGVSDQMYKRWEESGVQPPKVISVSFGQQWALRESGLDLETGFLDIFVNEVMPFVENKIGFRNGTRTLIGRSMGGFNGLQLLLKYPQKFKRAALICPAIWTISPFASEADVNDYIVKSGGKPFWIRQALKQSQGAYPSIEAWNQADPFLIGQKLLNGKSPKIYVSGNKEDKYGFGYGAEKFVEFARSKKVDVTFEAEGGNHCKVVNHKGVADFVTAP